MINKSREGADLRHTSRRNKMFVYPLLLTIWHNKGGLRWYLPPLWAGSVCTWWASRAGTRCPHARWRTETETTQVSSPRRSQSAVSYPSQTSRNILYKNSEKLHGIFFTRIVRNMFFPFLIWVEHKNVFIAFSH